MPTVRYWAAARELAGTREEPVEGGRLSTVLAVLGDRHGSRMQDLLARSVLLLDGVQVGRGDDAEVAGTAVLEVLPPYAGGAR